jgi:DNA-binding transcriptional MerR regulator
MKTGAVAKRFNVDPNTITAWTDRFAEFFTPEAKAQDNTQRDYQDEDIVVLNTIRTARVTNTPWDDIRAMLNSGQRDGKLPPEFTNMDGTQVAAVFSDMREMVVRLDYAQAEINRLSGDNAAKQELLTAQQKRIEELLKEVGKVESLREADATKQKRIEELVQEMGELREKIGRLAGKLEFYDAKEKPSDAQ